MLNSTFERIITIAGIFADKCPWRRIEIEIKIRASLDRKQSTCFHDIAVSII